MSQETIAALIHCRSYQLKAVWQTREWHQLELCLTGSVKSEPYDCLDSDNNLDGSSYNLGQLKNSMKADIWSMLGPVQALVHSW